MRDTDETPETPFGRGEPRFDGDRETRRIDAALDRLRRPRRLFMRRFSGLTVERGPSVWVL